MKKDPIIIWSIASREDMPYNKTTWFRCMGIETFIKKVQEENIIMGVTFDGNNLGLILEPKTP